MAENLGMAWYQRSNRKTFQRRRHHSAVEQLHGLSDSPSYQELIGGHTRRIWSDTNGEALIEAFIIRGMAHGVPLATTGGESCGAAGAIFLDVGISSTHYVARFWQLDECLVEMPRA